MYTEANGLSIAYHLGGEGEVVTLIHSLGLDLESWWLQVPVLEERFSVLRYDVRGHGRSGKPAGPYTLDQMAEDLYALLVTFGIPRTHVVGLSLGGMIAQTFALAHPEMVGSLVLCDTSSGYSAEEQAVFMQRAQVAETQGMEPLVQPTLERWFTEPFRAARPEVVARIAATLRANDPGGYAATCRAIAELALTDRLGALRLPTLVVVGEEDPGTPPAMARTIAKQIAGARLEVIPHAAHLVPVEKPDVFNALLLDFL